MIFSLLFYFYTQTIDFKPFQALQTAVTSITSNPKLAKVEEQVVQKPKPKGKGIQGRTAKKNITINDDWKLDIAKYICTKDWDCKTAVALFYAESGLNPGSKSGTNDHGVAQINKYYQRNRIKGRDLYNAQESIDIAHEIYAEQGFQPWSAFKSGKYKDYLDLSITQTPTVLTTEGQNIGQNGY